MSDYIIRVRHGDSEREFTAPEGAHVTWVTEINHVIVDPAPVGYAVTVAEGASPWHGKFAGDKVEIGAASTTLVADHVITLTHSERPKLTLEIR